jgi:signal transduction histidine kinase
MESRSRPAKTARRAGWPVGGILLLLAGGAVNARRARRVLAARYAAEAARARAAEAARRAADEQLREARRVQEAVTHAMALIDLQAGVALRLLGQRPEQARGALLAIREASKSSLRDLRSLATPVPTAAAPPEPLPRRPDQPRAGTARAAQGPDPVARPAARRDAETGHPGGAGTAGRTDPTMLAELAAQAAASGLQVRTQVAGEPRPLPAEVDLAAFSIVQEALSNVARHARPAAATVRVTYGDAELTVQVDDDGSGPAAFVAGAGIRSIREHAAAVGGVAEAGPRPAGGFRVRARLPLDPRLRR